jgi:hypothetical protein
VNRAWKDFIVYVAGLPGVADLVDSLNHLAHRVGSEWQAPSHRDAYVMARKSIMVRDNLRSAKPTSYMETLETK